MENRMEWHYLPMNEMQYNQAVREINDECACSLPVTRKPFFASRILFF